MEYVAIGCRLLIRVVFAVSAVTKLAGPSAFDAFVRSVRQLRVVPRKAAKPVAYVVVAAEVLTVVVLTGIVLALIGVLAFVRRTFVVLSVSGPSMEPSLADGDRLLARRAAGHLPPTGDVVAFAPLMENGRPVPASAPAGGRL